MKQNHPQVEISNARICAAIYLPDVQRGFYRGTRFDWSGVIGRLEYDGHNYYGPWFDRCDPSVHDFTYRDGQIVAGPCSAITGPVEEFTSGSKALGYDEAVRGGTFLKIGVGALRKPDEADYDEYRLYDLADPGKWTVRPEAAGVEFVQQVSTSGGFAYEYRKVVRLAEEKAEIVLEHSLTNTGRRAIESSVYNHNFLVLDGQAPGPDFRIAVPFEMHTDEPPQRDLAEIRSREIVYLKRLEAEECAYTTVNGFAYTPRDYDIRVENRRSKAGMRITGDRPLERLSLWSIRSVLSMEPFIAIVVAPGNVFRWNLTYNLYTL